MFYFWIRRWRKTKKLSRGADVQTDGLWQGPLCKGDNTVRQNLQGVKFIQKMMRKENFFFICKASQYKINFLSENWISLLNRVNERRYEFGDANGAESWVCAKIPHDGAIKKDCVPKVISFKDFLLSQLSVSHSFWCQSWCHQETLCALR